MHRATGGYLVLPVEETLQNTFSWEGLKSALRDKRIVIEEIGERLGAITTKGLRPEPIPLNAKVILIGEPLLHELLYMYDKSFKELFKVKAEFDKILAEYYPEKGLDGDAARKLQDQFTARLKYFIDGPLTDKLAKDATYGARQVMAVTGVVEERDGRKWITVIAARSPRGVRTRNSDRQVCA